jgi:energy-coupling factor transporter ATP-binding protein EcfA2
MKIVNTKDPAEMIKRFEVEQATKPKFKSGAGMSKRTYTPKDTKARMEQYDKDKQLRESTLKNKIPFINHDVSEGFYLSQGLVIVGGVSGRGKSTLAANMLAGFLDSQPRKHATVITNEETTEAVYNRTACVQLGAGYSFFDFQKGRLPQAKEEMIAETAKTLALRMEVVDGEAWDMTCLEDVVAVLEYAATNPDTGIVFLDYFQTVAFSRDNPHMEPWQVLKKLGLYLKDYGRKVGIPVVVFAQLKTDNSSESKVEFKDRVEGDRTIYNHSFQSIEIKPDFDNLTSKFIIWKDRFGYTQGREIEAAFEEGRFVTMKARGI